MKASVPPHPPHQPPKLVRILLWLAVVAVGGLLSLCALGEWLQLWATGVLEVLRFPLAWINFLRRVGPHVRFDLRTTLLAIGAFVGLLLVARLAMSRLPPHTDLVTSRPWKWSIAAVGGLLLLFVGGLATVALATELHWIRQSDESIYEVTEWHERDARWRSENNLRQIGLAVYNYHDAYTTLPLGGTFDDQGRQMHGWLTRLLPYVEQAGLYQRINFEKSWRAPENRDVFTTRIYGLQNSGLTAKGKTASDGYATADYAGNVWIFGRELPLSWKDLSDGTSNTFLAGEISSGSPAWGDAANYRDPLLGINRDPSGFGSPWKWRAHMLLCDGSVRFINEKIDPKVLQALATPNGGEPVGDY